MTVNNASANALVRTDLDGVFANRQGGSSSRSLEVAPPVFLSGLRSEWHYVDELGFMEVNGPDSPMKPKGFKGEPSRGGFKLGTATGNAEIFKYQDYVFSEEELSELAARGVDAEALHVGRCARFAMQHHEYSVGQFLSTASNYASAHVNSAPADISDPASELIADIDGAVNDLVDAGVDIDNMRICAVYHDGVNQLLKRHNEIKERAGFAGADVSATATFRKLGYATSEDVGNFWSQAFDVAIEPVVLRKRVKSSGSVVRVMNNDIAIIACPRPGTDGAIDEDAPGFVRTQTLSAENALGRLIQYNPPKEPNGVGFYMKQIYGLINPDNGGYYGALLDGVYS